MSGCSVHHVKWKDLADELMRQDSRLLRQGTRMEETELLRSPVHAVPIDHTL